MSEHARPRTTAELESGLTDVRQSPREVGVLRLIVSRPAVGQRVVQSEGRLDRVVGLVGDTWKDRPSTRTADQSPHPDMQLNVMNVRAVALIAGDEARWPLAGDQLFVDLDLSGENLPPGTRLSVGGAVIEVTDQPHTGCAKFVSRFGLDAMKFVNSPTGRALNLRGINARVVADGAIRAGDVVCKLTPVAGDRTAGP